MAARQMQILAGSASVMTAVILGLAGCAAASHPTAGTMRRSASQTTAGHASQAAVRAATAARRASPLLKCADPVAPGRAAGGTRTATGRSGQVAADAGSASPVPVATAGRATIRQIGVVNLSQPGLVMLCGPVIVHCPRGFRAIYRRDLSGRRPRVLLPYVAVCLRFPLRTLRPEPQLTPVPVVTRPLHTMPPQGAGS